MTIDNKLKQLKIYGEQHDIPNISQENALFLQDLLSLTKIKNMLEIGTANGFSAICFALQLQKQGGKLTTIEFSPNSRAQALQNFTDFGVSEIITSIEGNALDEILKLPDASFDCIFIDGMKKRTFDFVRLSLPKLTKNGFIIIDDVIKFRHKMQDFYDFLEKNDIQPSIIPIDVDDGIMLLSAEKLEKIKNGL